MSYSITNTSGGLVATVSDGTLDTASTSIALIGKNLPNYGIYQNQNFVRLLENWASSAYGNGAPTSISAPVTGQLWYDTTNNLLQVYNGSNFRSLGFATTSTSTPTTALTGDIWYDTTNKQMKVFNPTISGNWQVIGPPYAAGLGTSGSIVETFTDNQLSPAVHTVVSLYIGNDRVAIISKDAQFTLNVSEVVPGFSVIKPGINLSSIITNVQFTGLASNADLLDSLNSTDFMRATTNTATTGNLAINNDTGLTVGAVADFKVSVSSNNVYLENTNNGKDLYIRTRTGGGVQSNLIAYANGMIYSQGVLNVANVTDSTSSTTGALRVAGGMSAQGNIYVGGSANISGNASVTGNLTVTGDINITGAQNFNGNVVLGDATTDRVTFNALVKTDILPSANVTYNLGNTSLRWGSVYATTLYGTSTSAQYADLAERYAADRPYSPGTVVSIGGEAEITVATLNTDVFGVISTAPAYVMNDGAGTDETHPAVALVGRVPVRVTGQCSKGDKLVVGIAGVATKWVEEVMPDDNHPQDPLTQDKLVGRALVDKYTEEEELIEVVLAAH